jgi:hypothetical protein
MEQPPMSHLPTPRLAAFGWMTAAFVAGIASTLPGCSTGRETFPGRPADQVWTAMVKAAEQPVYQDWHVLENDVWADERTGRIEIWRLLRRYTDPPGQYPRVEDREWSFTVLLLPEEPPAATFEVRTPGVPGHAWSEPTRYFDQVWALLGGRPNPAMPESASPAAASSDATPPAIAPPASEPAEAAPASPREPAPPPVDLPT